MFTAYQSVLDLTNVLLYCSDEIEKVCD